MQFDDVIKNGITYVISDVAQSQKVTLYYAYRMFNGGRGVVISHSLKTRRMTISPAKQTKKVTYEKEITSF